MEELILDDLNNWHEKFEICVYAKKLLDKINYLNYKTQALQTCIATDEVKKAIYYARKYHAGQKRQSGEHFYSHPIEVAYMLSEYTAAYIPRYYKTDLIVTALLHDTIEDTELTKEVIAYIFDKKIAHQVQALSIITPEGQISSSEMIAKLYKEKNYDALLVKLFDRLHNIQTINAKSPERAQKIIEETIIHFLVLSRYLGALDIKNYLLQLCCTHLSTITKINYSMMCYYELFSLDNYQPLSLDFQNDITQNNIL